MTARNCPDGVEESMGKRGMPRGGVITTWTDDEWAAVRASLDAKPGRDGKRLRALRPLLPGRPDSQIHNALNIERRHRRGLCIHCGKEPCDEGYKSCERCRRKATAKNHANVSKGICGSCGWRPIDEKGSASRCSFCCEKRRRLYAETDRKNVQRFRKKQQAQGHRSKSRSYNMLKWLASRALPFLVSQVPEGAHVVDLFGGSGDLGIRCHHAGHDLLAYNDIHPMLAAFVQCIQAGEAGEMEDRIEALLHLEADPLLKVYERLKGWGPEDRIEAAAVLTVVARHALRRDMATLEISPERRPVRSLLSSARKAQAAFEDAEITCLDFAEAIIHHDAPGVLFLCDPPWPGAKLYEYDIEGRHRELLDRLMAAEGNFIVAMKSCRTGMAALIPAPYLYFRRGLPHRDLVASDFPLDHKGLEPIDKSRFAYLID
jgi:site-specific DNA-adenine methylase